jgi:hypothetical protein
MDPMSWRTQPTFDAVVLRGLKEGVHYNGSKEGNRVYNNVKPGGQGAYPVEYLGGRSTPMVVGHVNEADAPANSDAHEMTK